MFAWFKGFFNWLLTPSFTEEEKAYFSRRLASMAQEFQKTQVLLAQVLDSRRDYLENMAKERDEVRRMLESPCLIGEGLANDDPEIRGIAFLFLDLLLVERQEPDIRVFAIQDLLPAIRKIASSDPVEYVRVFAINCLAGLYHDAKRAVQDQILEDLALSAIDKAAGHQVNQAALSNICNFLSDGKAHHKLLKQDSGQSRFFRSGEIHPP